MRGRIFLNREPVETSQIYTNKFLSSVTLFKQSRKFLIIPTSFCQKSDIMSSLRNAVSRRPHKERAQLASREKWGILEKHKDYSLRAKDYNEKKKKLAILDQKVKERNPDEFSFGMLSAEKSRQGKHGSRGTENRLSHDAVQLLKTQDAGYLRTLAARGRREIERVTQEVGMDQIMQMDWFGSNRVVFDDNNLHKDQRESLGGEILEEVILNETSGHDEPQGIENIETVDINIENTNAKTPKSRKLLTKQMDAAAKLQLERKKRKRLQEVRKTKLELLQKRQREILAAADQLDHQRAKMARSIGGTNKDGVKFKIRERKR